MRTALLLLALAFPCAAIPDSAANARPDVVYVKAPAGELGFRPLRGEVRDLTREYVLFQEAGKEEPRLYAKEEVRRIELAADERKLQGIAQRFWNEPRRLARGERGFFDWALDLASDLLPAGVLLGVLLLAALYLVVTTALQGYERFVLEGNLKRLNTAKLTEEIAKLRIEVMELRKRLGLPAVDDAPALPGFAPPAVRAEAAARPSPELRVGEFLKYTILRLRTPAQVQDRRQDLVRRWSAQKERGALWLRIRYLGRSLFELAMIILGWLFVTGAVGNIFMIAADPSYGRELGAAVLFFMLVLSAVLAVALARLMQDRRIRREAYEEVLSGEEH
jgi:hypothetical protein